MRDYVSRDLFADILENEEEHVDTLEKQFDMIERMGIENYIQLQSKAADGRRGRWIYQSPSPKGRGFFLVAHSAPFHASKKSMDCGVIQPN